MENFDKPYAKAEITADLESVRHLTNHLVEAAIDDSDHDAVTAAAAEYFNESHTTADIEAIVEAYYARVEEPENNAISRADGMSDNE